MGAGQIGIPYALSMRRAPPSGPDGSADGENGPAVPRGPPAPYRGAGRSRRQKIKPPMTYATPPTPRRMPS